jgi:hypothetical protein
MSDDDDLRGVRRPFLDQPFGVIGAKLVQLIGRRTGVGSVIYVSI